MHHAVYVDGSRCTGCGECIEVCPEGAVYMVDSVATIDHDRCSGCDACVKACPEEAIYAVALTSQLTDSQPPDDVTDAIIQVKPVRRSTLSLPQTVLPALAAVASFAGRELLPRLLDAISFLPRERQVDRRNGNASAQGQGAGGKRFRQRQRGRQGKD